ncbi:MAG: chemotaxis protein CheW [Pseudomonadota bacterium]
MKNLVLLPNVVVAEVMNYSKPEVRQGVPEWLLGDLAWRGTSVPVVSIEGMMGDTVVEPVHRGRTIIMNTLNGEASLPHIGMVAQAIPSLLHVTSESIDSSDISDNLGGLVKQAVMIDDKQAFIPDLDELERLVLDCMATD